MSGGGKGGSTRTEVPQYIQNAHKNVINRADQQSRVGYMPFMGNDVAGFAPGQIAGFQGADQMASAFGMPAQAMAGMQSYLPEATNRGGIQGYSSFQPFDFARAQLEANNPAQYAAYTSQWINPQTGDLSGFGFNNTGDLQSILAQLQAQQNGTWVRNTGNYIMQGADPNAKFVQIDANGNLMGGGGPGFFGPGGGEGGSGQRGGSGGGGMGGGGTDSFGGGGEPSNDGLG